MAGVAGRSGGRNRKSAAEHQLSGSFRRDRGHSRKTAGRPAGVPTPPRALGPMARAEWNRMITRLTASKALAKTDDAALYQAAQLFAEIETAVDQRRDVERLIVDMRAAAESLEGEARFAALEAIGQQQRLLRACAVHVRQGRQAMRTWLVEFGLTPAARTRVQVSDDETRDEWSDFEAGDGVKH